MYDFDKGVERRGTNCAKWDWPLITEDITPMWIADMDFEVAPAITRNLQNIAGQGAFGYQFLSDRYYQAIMDWMKRRHHYELKKEEITYVPNVVLGLCFGVEAISNPGDEIIIMTPVYGPFFKVVVDTGRTLVESPMKDENGYYTMDFEDLESRITDKTRAVIICNPHNPVGRMWTREELQKLADICIKHNLYILSDDIHSELAGKGHEHVFISTLSDEIRQRSLVFTSPSKAFNLAGIHVANCFIADEEVRKRFRELAEKSHAAENNAFSEAALVGAYEESEEWLDELNVYIQENQECFANYIQNEIPKLKIRKAEGTYLAWVDFRDAGIPYDQLQEYLRKECAVFVNDGDFFGASGVGFMRFNLACPRKNMIPVLEKMRETFS